VHANGAGRLIALTEVGRDFLAENRKMAPRGLRAAPNLEESLEERRR
jgi:hypothetical protein